MPCTQILNPLPGAYFCSAQIAGQVFDSSVLRVDNQTLQIVCLPGQSPSLLQPSTPRCATRGVQITPNTLVLRTVVSTTNTINLGGGVVAPTPTYDINLMRTMEIPEDVIIATPLATPLATPPGTPIVVAQQSPAVATPLATPPGTPVAVAQQSPAVAIGVVVGIGALVMLLGLGLALIIFFVKKRKRNQLKAVRSSSFERCEFTNLL